MTRARMLAFPSVTLESGEAEGLGNVALEAQALGLPVVGHRNGGIPEAVRAGETGILVPERDTAAFASALIELATNEDLWQRFSHAGQRYVREHFDLCKGNRLLEDHYDAVLKAGKVGCFDRAHAEPVRLGAGTSG
jgi:colanic acid/amylovoran biosynthesis glycosyltransferase